MQQRRAAADHHAILLGVEVGEIDVAEQLARGHQVRDPAAIAERIARHRRIVDQLVADIFAEEIVLRQRLRDHLAISEFGDAAAAVQQHDFLEALVSLGILDDAEERCQTGPGPDQIQIATIEQIVDHQRSGGLAADDDLIAFLEVLQSRGQRTVLHLDREEFEVFFVIRARNAIGAQQRLLADLQADHGELAVAEAERRVARGREAEEIIGPVVNAEDALVIEVAHCGMFRVNMGAATTGISGICVVAAGCLDLNH